MKCDVCGHKILIGSKECSHCGYQLEQRVVRVRDDNDEIVTVKKLDLKEKVQVAFLKSRSMKFDKLVIVLLFFIGVILLDKGIEWINGKYSTDISQMSFEEVIDEYKDDQYTTVSLAMQYSQDIIDEYKELGLNLLYTQEEVNDYEDGLEAKYLVTGEYNNNEYTVSFTVRQGVRTEYYLEVFDEVGGDLKEFPLLDIDIFSHMMGYNSIVDELNKVREYNPQIGYEYEDDKIEAYEWYTVDDVYTIYYKIAAKGYELNRD